MNPALRLTLPVTVLSLVVGVPPASTHRAEFKTQIEWDQRTSGSNGLGVGGSLTGHLGGELHKACREREVVLIRKRDGKVLATDQSDRQGDFWLQTKPGPQPPGTYEVRARRTVHRNGKHRHICGAGSGTFDIFRSALAA